MASSWNGKVTGSEVTRVRVGGTSVLVGEGRLRASQTRVTKSVINLCLICGRLGCLHHLRRW